MVGRVDGCRHPGAQSPGIESRRLLQVRHRYGDVIEPSYHCRSSLPPGGAPEAAPDSSRSDPDEMDLDQRLLATLGPDRAAHGQPRRLADRIVVPTTPLGQGLPPLLRRLPQLAAGRTGPPPNPPS